MHTLLDVVLLLPAGLIFVAYCVICYLVTALLFSLLILDLAALVISVAPSKAIFKYTDLVYTGVVGAPHRAALIAHTTCSCWLPSLIAGKAASTCAWRAVEGIWASSMLRMIRLLCVMPL